MKKVTMKIPVTQNDIVTRIFPKRRNDIHLGKEIITDISDIRINGVEIKGDAIRIYGNNIRAGFFIIRDVKDSNEEKVGISIDFDEVTANLWNSSAMKSLDFIKHNTSGSRVIIAKQNSVGRRSLYHLSKQCVCVHTNTLVRDTLIPSKYKYSQIRVLISQILTFIDKQNRPII